MFRIYLFSSLVFLFSQSYGQSNLSHDIQYLEGIWIAEDYFNSFEETKSPIQSKPAFDATDPVALRINTKEMKDGVLNVGYGTLHDHFIRPEVSKYVIFDGDTIIEQGCFNINVLKADSLDFHCTSGIYDFYGRKSYFTWKFTPDTTLIIYLPATVNEQEKTIRYKRIAYNFSEEYPYPNPLYYYIRSRMLVGNYIVKDSTGRVVCKKMTIGLDGKSKGCNLFANKIFNISTDIYCGPESLEDYVLLYSFDKKFEVSSEVFIYNRITENVIGFYSGKWENIEDQSEVRDKIIYTLKKK